MQQRPPTTINLSDLLGLIESIDLAGFKGSLIIHVERLTIELHLSGGESPDANSETNSNGQEEG